MAQPGVEAHLAYYLAKYGTMSVLVNADDWQLYAGGIYNHPNCRWSHPYFLVLIIFILIEFEKFK